MIHHNPTSTASTAHVAVPAPRQVAGQTVELEYLAHCPVCGEVRRDTLYDRLHDRVFG